MQHGGVAEGEALEFAVVLAAPALHDVRGEGVRRSRKAEHGGVVPDGFANLHHSITLGHVSPPHPKTPEAAVLETAACGGEEAV